MSKNRLGIIICVVGLMAIVTVSLPLTRTEADTKHQNHNQTAKMDMGINDGAKAFSLDRIHSEQLPAVLKSIDEAVGAVEAGDSKAALNELHKAKKLIAAVNEAIGRYIKPKFVNNRCPVMGTPIKPGKVTKNLIREFKGQKVAFCCARCPAKWDKLTDTEKQAKLANVKQ